MNVIYGANDQYARHLAVSLCSLMEQNRKEPIRAYILSMGLSAQARAGLEAVVKRPDCSLIFLEVGNLKKRFPYEVQSGSFDISVLGRFFLGELLPPEIERILYLDCDTVVLRPLKKLYETDLKGRVLGAVMEPTIYENVRKQIGLRHEDPYYNSGMLLIDVNQWREEGVQEKLVKCYGKLSGQSLFCDQDVINQALQGRIHTLSPGYNFFTNYHYFSYQTLVKLSPAYRRVSKQEYELARRVPAIVHYAGDERPWLAGNHNPYRKKYEACLSRTAWSGTPRQKGKELYLQAYHMMNLVTRICPPFRIWLSSCFGPAMIEERSRKAGSKVVQNGR